MIKLTDIADININYSIEKVCPKENVLFFDIETTGFSRKFNHIYLIGCMYYENNKLVYTQLFAEKKSEEKLVILEFKEILRSHPFIINFNGKSFDIPFVLERAELYNIDFDFDECNSIDLYQIIKPYKSLLKLENIKQKSIEILLGIDRKDPFNGGELIEIYKEYTVCNDERLLNALLLHNKEDVFYMGKLIEILTFTDALSCNYKINSIHLADYTNHNGELNKELQIRLKTDDEIPFNLSYKDDYCIISGSGKDILISIYAYCGELKLYFENYKDYYYLPLEDNAIHKSIASFVDKEHREKATAKNCYVRNVGTYLPSFTKNNTIFSQLFRKDYADKMFYIDSNLITGSDTYNGLVSKYVQLILKHLINQ